MIFYFTISPIWADSIAVEDPNLTAFTIQKIVREERESREKLPYEQAFKAPRTTTPVDERTLLVVEIRDEKLDRELANQIAFRAKAGNLSSNDIIVLYMRNVAKKNEIDLEEWAEVSLKPAFKKQGVPAEIDSQVRSSSPSEDPGVLDSLNPRLRGRKARAEF
ncbi:MAG: hypothetical protein LW875_03595 [Proteobacteria bacterium]|nr:hypothetical protein [Pseudomonadota bacterium]